MSRIEFDLGLPGAIPVGEPDGSPKGDLLALVVLEPDALERQRSMLKWWDRWVGQCAVRTRVDRETVERGPKAAINAMELLLGSAKRKLADEILGASVFAPTQPQSGTAIMLSQESDAYYFDLTARVLRARRKSL